MYNEPAPGPRLVFSNMQHGEPQRRATMDDTLDPSLSRPTYPGFAPGRANSIDGLGFGASHRVLIVLRTCLTAVFSESSSGEHG